jgi:hypothetical protein
VIIVGIILCSVQVITSFVPVVYTCINCSLKFFGFGFDVMVTGSFCLTYGEKPQIFGPWKDYCFNRLMFRQYVGMFVLDCTWHGGCMR